MRHCLYSFVRRTTKVKRRRFISCLTYFVVHSYPFTVHTNYMYDATMLRCMCMPCAKLCVATEDKITKPKIVNMNKFHWFIIFGHDSDLPNCFVCSAWYERCAYGKWKWIDYEVCKVWNKSLTLLFRRTVYDWVVIEVMIKWKFLYKLYLLYYELISPLISTQAANFANSIFKCN